MINLGMGLLSKFHMNLTRPTGLICRIKNSSLQDSIVVPCVGFFCFFSGFTRYPCFCTLCSFYRAKRKTSSKGCGQENPPSSNGAASRTLFRIQHACFGDYDCSIQMWFCDITCIFVKP